MRLFYINDSYEVELNREWIVMIPEFQALIKRDKGSRGDYRGDLKLKAKKEFAYIYFVLDFTSPLRNWSLEDKKLEALRYVGLDVADIDDKVMEAYTTYEVLLAQSSRSLRTLQALHAGQDKIDAYFREVDFEKVDKQGKAFYSPEQYMNNITKLPKMNAAVKEYEKQVEEDLKADTGIRGKATLGGKEGHRRTEVWKEGTAPKDDPDAVDNELVGLDLDGLTQGGVEE